MIALEVISPSTKPTSPSTELLPIASSVPIGQSGLVHIVGRNDMTTPQKMGCTWVVTDPDGVVVEDHTDDWAGWPYPTDVDPDDTHEFISFLTEGFNLDKVGTYTIAIELFMNRASPVVVDSYEGDLCTTTTEVPPEYEEIQHTVYPYAYIYDGEVEVVTATFKTDPFTPVAWIADKFASNLKEEARKEGGRVLEVRAYVDKTPLFWTDFRIDVISTPLTETTGGPRQTGIALWATILIIALAIIAVIVVATLAVTTILDRFEHKPISEKVKKTWSKPTLIGAVNDFEIELNLTPTPSAELEGMSEAELRDYCDMLAEEIAPPGIPWLTWVIAGGAGVLGLGAVALLARKKKK